MRSHRAVKHLLPILFVACSAACACAEVVRVEITDRSPFAEGKVFGPAGAYECIKGRTFLETDPRNAANDRICVLQRAPRNADGRVESWTDFFLLKPVEPAKGNGQLLYDVNNRGNMLALWTFNDGERVNDPQTEPTIATVASTIQGNWLHFQVDVLGNPSGRGAGSLGDVHRRRWALRRAMAIARPEPGG